MFFKEREPIPNMCAAEVKAFFINRNSEKDLADAYAIIHNHFWVAADNEYDYEEGSPEHKVACAITDEWGSLMDAYKEKIFEILTSEGVDIPETGQMRVLEPFMARFGYKNNGVW